MHMHVPAPCTESFFFTAEISIQAVSSVFLYVHIEYLIPRVCAHTRPLYRRFLGFLTILSTQR